MYNMVQAIRTETYIKLKIEFIDFSRNFYHLCRYASHVHTYFDRYKNIQIQLCIHKIRLKSRVRVKSKIIKNP